MKSKESNASPPIHSSRFSQTRKPDEILNKTKYNQSSIKNGQENTEKNYEEQLKGASVLQRAKLEVMKNNFDKTLFKKGLKEIMIETNAKQVIKNNIDHERSPKVITTNNAGFIINPFNQPYSKSPEPRNFDSNFEENRQKLTTPTNIETKEKENRESTFKMNMNESDIKLENELETIHFQVENTDANQMKNENVNLSLSLEPDNKVNLSKKGGEPNEIKDISSQPSNFQNFRKHKKNKFSYKKNDYSKEESFTQEKEKEKLKLKIQPKKTYEIEKVIPKSGSNAIINSEPKTKFFHGFFKFDSENIKSQNYTPVNENMKNSRIENKTFQEEKQDRSSSVISQYSKNSKKEMINLSQPHTHNKTEDENHNEYLKLLNLKRKGLIIDINQPNPNNLPINLVGFGKEIEKEVNRRIRGSTKIEGTHNYLLPHLSGSSSLFNKMFDNYNQKISDYILKNKEKIKFDNTRLLDKQPDLYLDGKEETNANFNKRSKLFSDNEKESIQRKTDLNSTNHHTLFNDYYLNKQDENEFKNNVVYRIKEDFRGGKVDLTPLPRKRSKCKDGSLEFNEYERNIVATRRKEYNNPNKRINIMIKELYKIPFENMLPLVIKIQQWWKRLKKDTRNKAAGTIQKIFKGYMTRSRLREINYIFYLMKKNFQNLENILSKKLINHGWNNLISSYNSSPSNKIINRNNIIAFTITKSVNPNILSKIRLIQTFWRFSKQYKIIKILRPQNKDNKTQRPKNIPPRTDCLFSRKQIKSDFMSKFVIIIQRLWRKLKQKNTTPKPTKLKLKNKKVEMQVNHESLSTIPSEKQHLEINKMKSRKSIKREDDDYIQKPILKLHAKIVKEHKSSYVMKKMILIQRLFRKLKQNKNIEVDTPKIIFQPYFISKCVTSLGSTFKIIQIQRIFKRHFNEKKKNKIENDKLPNQKIIIPPNSITKKIKDVGNFLKIMLLQRALKQNFRKKCSLQNKNKTNFLHKKLISSMNATKIIIPRFLSRISKIQNLWRENKKSKLSRALLKANRINKGVKKLVNSIKKIINNKRYCFFQDFSKEKKNFKKCIVFPPTYSKLIKQNYCSNKVIKLQKAWKKIIPNFKRMNRLIRVKIVTYPKKYTKSIKTVSFLITIKLLQLRWRAWHEGHKTRQLLTILKKNKNDSLIAKKALPALNSTKVFQSSFGLKPVILLQRLFRKNLTNRKQNDTRLRSRPRHLPNTITKNIVSLDTLLKIIRIQNKFKRWKLRRKSKTNEDNDVKSRNIKKVNNYQFMTKNHRTCVRDKQAIKILGLLRRNFKVVQMKLNIAGSIITKENIKTNNAINKVIYIQKRFKHFMTKQLSNPPRIHIFKKDQVTLADYFEKTYKENFGNVKATTLVNGLRKYIDIKKDNKNWRMSEAALRNVLSSMKLYSKVNKQILPLSKIVLIQKRARKFLSSILRKKTMKPICKGIEYSTKQNKPDMKKTTDTIKNFLFASKFKKIIKMRKQYSISKKKILNPNKITKNNRSLKDILKLILLQREIRKHINKIKNIRTSIIRNPLIRKYTSKQTSFVHYTKLSKIDNKIKIILIQKQYRIFKELLQRKIMQRPRVSIAFCSKQIRKETLVNSLKGSIVENLRKKISKIDICYFTKFRKITDLGKITKVQKLVRLFLLKKKVVPEKKDKQKGYLMSKYLGKLIKKIDDKQSKYYLKYYFNRYYQNTRAKRRCIAPLPVYFTSEWKLNPIFKSNAIKRGFMKNYIKNRRISLLNGILTNKYKDEKLNLKVYFLKWRNNVQNDKEKLNDFLDRIDLKQDYRFINCMMKNCKDKQKEEENKGNDAVSKIVKTYNQANLRKSFNKLIIFSLKKRQQESFYTYSNRVVEESPQNQTKKATFYSLTNPKRLSDNEYQITKSDKYLFYLHYLAPKFRNTIKQAVNLEEKEFIIKLQRKEEKEESIPKSKGDLKDFSIRLNNRIKRNAQEKVIEDLKNFYSDSQLKIVAKMYLADMFRRKNKNEFDVFKQLKRRMFLIDLLYTIKQKSTKNSQEYIFNLLKGKDTQKNFFNLGSLGNVPNQSNFAQESHYYRTIKGVRRLVHLPKEYESDDKDKEVVYNHMQSVFPKNSVRNLYSHKWWNLIEKNKGERILNVAQLFTNKNDPILAKYIEYILRKEKKIPNARDIVSARLKKLKKFTNSNIFAVTKVSDDIHADIVNNVLCKSCFCKSDENNQEDDEPCKCECHSQFSDPENNDVEENGSANKLDHYSSANEVSLQKIEEEEEKKRQLNIRLTVKKVEEPDEFENYDIFNKISILPNSSKANKKLDSVFKKMADNEKKKKEDVQKEKKKKEEEEQKKIREQKEMEKLKKQQEEQEKERKKRELEEDQIQRKKLLEEYGKERIVPKKDEKPKLKEINVKNDENLKRLSAIKKPILFTPKVANVSSMLRKNVVTTPKQLILRDYNEEDPMKQFGGSASNFNKKKESRKSDYK